MSPQVQTCDWSVKGRRKDDVLNENGKTRCIILLSTINENINMKFYIQMGCETTEQKTEGTNELQRCWTASIQELKGEVLAPTSTLKVTWQNI